MQDMLVRLYDLPDSTRLVERLAGEGITIRRAMAYEKGTVVTWVRERFGTRWGSECDVAFGVHPISCYLATSDGEILGFGCYDSTYRNFFGPTGVAEDARGRGIGTGILLACLEAMHGDGYAYAIIGGVGPKEFYTKAASATVIPGSTPGIYRDFLKDEDS